MNKYYSWSDSTTLINVITEECTLSYFFSKQWGEWEEGYTSEHVEYMLSIGQCFLVPDTITRLLGVPLWVKSAQ